MTAASNEIRSFQAAGSGTGEPNPAANSRVGSEAVSDRSGTAPSNYVTPIVGGELHVIEAGRCVSVQIRTGRGLRNRLTASLALDEAELWFRRGLEIAVNARLTRQNTGG